MQPRAAGRSPLHTRQGPGLREFMNKLPQTSSSTRVAGSTLKVAESHQSLFFDLTSSMCAPYHGQARHRVAFRSWPPSRQQWLCVFVGQVSEQTTKIVMPMCTNSHTEGDKCKCSDKGDDLCNSNSLTQTTSSHGPPLEVLGHGRCLPGSRQNTGFMLNRKSSHKLCRPRPAPIGVRRAVEVRRGPFSLKTKFSGCFWPQEWSGLVRTGHRIYLVFVLDQTVDSRSISDQI